MQLKLPWILGPKATKERNIKMNIDAFGDQMNDKVESIIRFAGHNVNGIKHSPDKLGVEEIGAMHEMKIDVLAMMETNINWSHDARATFMANANLQFNKTARCVMSGGSAVKEGYLPGGTAMISMGKTSGRVIQRGADPLGSFTWMALRGRKETGILVINGYRVCQKAGTKAGPDTAYSQIWTKQRAQGEKKPDPRNKILKDISMLIEEWGKKGFHPIIMMDANADVSEKQLSDFMKENGVIDLITDIHSEDEPPST